MKAKKHKYWWILGVVFFFCSQVSGQDSLRIGDAFDYLAYQVFNQHIETADYYYSTSDVGIVKWNKEDYSYVLLSKVDGLSDVEPKHMVYDEATDAIIIAYVNSNIDILYPDLTFNLRDILVNQKIIGRRDINKLLTDDGELYIIGDFGVAFYDLKNTEFIRTLFTDKPTIDFNVTDERYFISTGDGYYSFDRKKDIQYIVTLSEWEKLSEQQGLPAQYSPGKIGASSHCIVLQDDTDLYIAESGGMEFSHLRKLEQHASIPFMKNHLGELQIGVRVSVPNSYVADNYVLKVHQCEITDTVTSPCFNFLTDYLETSTGDVLLGDTYLGFHYIDSEGACNVESLPGPQGVQAYGLTFRNDTLYVAGGGVDKLRYTPQKRNYGFSYFDGNQWHSFSILNNEAMKGRDFNDIVQVLPSPDGKRLFLNSAWKGLAVYDFDKFTFYNNENSCLETIGDGTVRLPAMVMDEKGNVYLSNYFGGTGLQYFGLDGTCTSIEIPVGAMLGEMIIDQNGVLWACIIGNDGDILVYDPETGQSRIISRSNSVLSGDARSLALDKNGAVWVGATDGVYVFYDAFKDPGVRPVVDLNNDGFGDYLLMDQLITTVGIDAANRKWFGTQNGVIVQSANGLAAEMRLTTGNSPLPSDVILDFAFDEEKGITYIGTEKGVLGIKIKATSGGKVHKKNIYTYPNPVRPGYDGPIAIKGLVENAHVKIVDQEGLLVKTLEAYGGQAIWDGRNLNNEKVASGVYFVFSSAYSTTMKPDAAVTKILVVK